MNDRLTDLKAQGGRDFVLFIYDRRYSVPDLLVLSARNEPDAKRAARAASSASL